MEPRPGSKVLDRLRGSSFRAEFFPMVGGVGVAPRAGKVRYLGTSLAAGSRSLCAIMTSPGYLEHLERYIKIQGQADNKCQ